MPFITNSSYTTAAVTAATLGTAVYAYKYYQEHKKPSTWTRVGKLIEINAYPIKSCGEVSLERADCTILGLKSGWLRDRFLMVVDAENNFITARAYPELLLVHPQIRNSVLTLTHPHQEAIHVNLAEVVALEKPSKGYVWGTEVPVLDCGSEVSEWFCRLLDKPPGYLRLVYYASQQSRKLRAHAKLFNFRYNDAGALPDEVSFNLLNEASVQDLNKRMSGPGISPRNFRPNFLLQGAEAYAEDNWRYIKIGDNIFEIIKPCTRCVLTTIDPETGIRETSSEPLKTLQSYRLAQEPVLARQAGRSPRMGVQMALRWGSGAGVANGDDVYVA